MKYTDILKDIEEILSPLGYETYGFKTGWYNDKVAENFKLKYAYDTFAILVISTPDMFDKSLIPFIIREECLGIEDLLDQCVREQFNSIKEHFSSLKIEAIHDFELLPSRQPKILVQTAGHVSGAAFFYQRKDVQPDPWDPTRKIYGVSYHPKYGGWFALRGVLIFQDVLCEDLVPREPLDCVSDMERRQELLERFNGNWQDWTYRDMITVEKKYSDIQKEYFATAPKDRQPLIDRIRSEFGKIK